MNYALPPIDNKLHVHWDITRSQFAVKMYKLRHVDSKNIAADMYFAFGVGFSPRSDQFSLRKYIWIQLAIMADDIKGLEKFGHTLYIPTPFKVKSPLAESQKKEGEKS